MYTLYVCTLYIYSVCTLYITVLYTFMYKAYICMYTLYVCIYIYIPTYIYISPKSHMDTLKAGVLNSDSTFESQRELFKKYHIPVLRSHPEIPV